MEGSKAVINSTITPNMTFTQTSQKFGQWSDVRANTVYGLGFSSEAELSKFVEKFQEVKEATKKAMKAMNATSGGTDQNANGNNSYLNQSGTGAVPPPPPPTGNTPMTSANTSPVTGRASLLAPVDISQHESSGINEPSPPSSSSAPGQPHSDPTSPSHKQRFGGALPADAKSEGGAGAATGQQLKYENERLKLALAQSSANAKNWEIELTTLRNNNLRLTSALQESTANVDEWKRQLQTYKDENSKMKTQIQDLMDGNELSTAMEKVEVTNDLRKEIVLLKGRIESLEGELKAQEVELKSATNKSLRDRTADPSMKQLNSLVSQFSKHLAEMSLVQKEMEKIMSSSKST